MNTDGIKNLTVEKSRPLCLPLERVRGKVTRYKSDIPINVRGRAEFKIDYGDLGPSTTNQAKQNERIWEEALRKLGTERTERNWEEALSREFTMYDVIEDMSEQWKTNEGSYSSRGEFNRESYSERLEELSLEEWVEGKCCENKCLQRLRCC